MIRVLVATPEPIGSGAAGPAIRAAHMARVLGARHDVVLASGHGADVSPVDGRAVVDLADVAVDDLGAAVLQGRVSIDRADLVAEDLPICFDWFDPFQLEALHRGGADRIRRMDLVEGARQTLLDQAVRGDFFVCSNQTQRDHWLGFLAAAGRINHLNHEADPTFEELIAIAPFGVEGAYLASRTEPLRSEFAHFGPDDPVLLWAGGLHDWLDPRLVVDAMPAILEEVPDTRLVFLAGPHPNTSLETMGVRGDAIARAQELRLFGSDVVFVNRWIDFAERLDWFADATIGVVAHRPHLEARFSHRTRLLDHLAVGLPTVTTGGDPAGAILTGSGAATSARPGEAEDFAAAVVAVLSDDGRKEAMRAAARSLGATLSWERTLAPIVRWLESPTTAPDRRAGAQTGQIGGAGAANAATRMAGRARMHLAEGGARQLADRTWQSARRRWRR